MRRSAIIIGIKGETLTDKEINYIKYEKPLGVILFARNILNKYQTLKLVKSIKTLLGKDCMILIDEEGGRVTRLSKLGGPKFATAKSFGDSAKKNFEKTKITTYKSYKKIGRILAEIGINFNCAPVLDLFFKDSHKVIGDRAFSRDPDVVSVLSLQACKGLISEGVTPIIKHIPGHGRAKSDSHLMLPTISNKDKELNEDFFPFVKLNFMPIAMIAHIKYSSFDSHNCATYSKKIIQNLIRSKIGFKGILISDDLCMKALKGSYFYRAKKAINAGCEIVLHCEPNLSKIYKSTLGAGLASSKLIKKLKSIKKLIPNNNIS